ncbi:shikimate kinase [Rhizobium miluonense]|uniref:Shikimate kinase n=2 Tax=Rhizobium/Agrobacterium group TaxID=227290 RepID=A0A1C3WN81_9HYPH|nr:shikimate kinase [Rhizobium miluonense]
MFTRRRLDATGAFDDTVSKEIVNGPMSEQVLTLAENLRDKARAALGRRNLVLVGLMGAGKSSVGRLVAQQLSIPFVDTDAEIERVSRMTIAELFAAYGEQEFRALETRVIKRLLRGGPRVVSTGGGAFINENTRQHVKRGGLSVWLKADIDVLWERVNKRDTRPLLKTENPKQTLESLMNARYPIYAEADLTVLSRDVSKEVMVKEVLAAIVEGKKAESKAP